MTKFENRVRNYSFSENDGGTLFFGFLVILWVAFHRFTKKIPLFLAPKPSGAPKNPVVGLTFYVNKKFPNKGGSRGVLFGNFFFRVKKLRVWAKTVKIFRRLLRRF